MSGAGESGAAGTDVVELVVQIVTAVLSLVAIGISLRAERKAREAGRQQCEASYYSTVVATPIMTAVEQLRRVALAMDEQDAGVSLDDFNKQFYGLRQAIRSSFDIWGNPSLDGHRDTASEKLLQLQDRFGEMVERESVTGGKPSYYSLVNDACAPILKAVRDADPRQA